MADNIYKKMSAITAELTAVAKNLNVGIGKAAYKAVGEADVLAAVKPLEEKHGVYSYPYSRKIVEADLVTTTSEYQGKVTEKTNRYLRIETVYRFVNIDNPDEYIDITTYGDGIDPQDKAVGKAMTYSDKYALLKAYKIITGEDPDQFKSEEGKTEKKLTFREKVIIVAREKGIDLKELAKDYEITNKTSELRYEEILKDLEEGSFLTKETSKKELYIKRII